jgi:hypothetical protein
MDNNIFELWGNIFLTAARGQKQMENAGKWMKGGFYDMPDSLTGINAIISSSTEYLKIFNMASESFLKSTKEYLSLMELVPKKDYDSLFEEFEDLKKRTEEKSSGKVDKFLNEELSLQTQNLRSFEELMRKQTEQFQDLITNFTKFINQKQTTPSKEDLTKKEEKKSSQARKRPPAFSSKRPSGKTAPKK